MFGLSRYERARKAHPLAVFLPARGVELRGAGTKRMARCPFHQPDDTPSLSVDLDKDLWHCFACAGTPNAISGGTAVEWLMRQDGIAKNEAVHRLLQLVHDDEVRTRALPAIARGVPTDGAAASGAVAAPAPAPASASVARLAPGAPDPLLAAAEFYHAELGRHPAAQDYLARRGITDAELVRRFQIGYASGRLLATVPETGDTVEHLVAAGILARRGDKLREALAGSITFPIPAAAGAGAAPDGAVVGFYGRRVSGTGPDHLYLAGPHRGVWNAPALAAYDVVLVTEAVIDALSAWILGYPNAIALYGTGGLTDDHVALLAGAARAGRLAEIVLAVDNDPPGDQAALRLAHVLPERLGELMPRLSRLHVPKLAGVKDVNDYLVQAPGPLAEKRAAFAALFAAREVLREALPPSAPVEGRAGDACDGSTSPAAAPVRTTHATVAVHARGIDVSFPAGPNGTPARVYSARPSPAILPDRLRVILTARAGDAAHLDQLDLYSARSRTAFAGKLARVAGLPLDALERELLDVVAEVERHVAAQAEASEKKKSQPPPMSPAERAEALEFLRAPDLLERILADMDECGYCGEEANKLLGYLVSVSRKDRFPLSAVVLSQSGAGKSALAETVEKLTPPEDVFLFSRVTPQALFYLEPDTLVHRLLIIEERSGSAAADYGIRVLQSRHSLTQAVPIKDPATGKIKTAIFTVHGPIAYIETTTEAAIHPENATRSFELFLDESPEQTRRVQDRQKRAKGESQAARGRRIEGIRRRHHNAQRLLEPIEARIPFARLLRFPSDSLRTRRDHPRFLNLIAALAFLRQKQRPVKQDATGRYIEATADDYRVAYELAGVVLGSSLAELSKPLRSFLESLGKLGANPEGFTRRDIRRHTNLPDYRVRTMLGELVNLEYVEPIEGKQGQRYRYRLSDAAVEESRILTGLTPPDDLARLWSGDSGEKSTPSAAAV